MSGAVAPDPSAGLPFGDRDVLFGGCDWRAQAARDSDAEIERVVERLRTRLAALDAADPLADDWRRQLEAYEFEAGRRSRARRRRAARAAAGPGLRPPAPVSHRHRRV